MSEYRKDLYNLLQIIDNPQRYNSFTEYEEIAIRQIGYYISKKWEDHIENSQPDPYDKWRDNQLT